MTRTRTCTRLLATAATALAALAAAVNPAAADSVEKTWRIGPATDNWWYPDMGQGCQSTFQNGVYGAYGAWGNFIDGCTAQAMCQYEFCKISTASGSLWNNDKNNFSNSRATCSSRLRIHGPSWGPPGPVLWFRDGSGSGGPTCSVSHRLDDVRYLRRGQFATVQTNGVRAPGEYGARVTSIVELKQTDPPLSYWFG